VGKDWAKGLTAATDPRVAKAAAAHRGKIYQRRTPFEECRWPIAGRTTLPLEWSDGMAYIVGLTATDGCLFSGRRKINFKSEDRQLVETYLSVLGRANRVKRARTRTGGVVYFTEFHDSRLYEWFRSVGLTPRKSLTLGPIDVPNAYLLPLARGLMDGDGSVLNFVHRPTVKTYPNYWYERIRVCFHSASRPHIDWLRSRLRPLTGTPGYVEVREREGRHDFFKLQYGKAAAVALLTAFYADAGAPRLVRKWQIWDEYVTRQRSADGGSRTLMSYDTRS
jgi:LAGLIDADG DNA endonuclease family protein